MSDTETPLFSALRRLYPYARRVVPALALGLFAALVATLVKLGIPQALNDVVNQTLTGHRSSVVGLWIGVAVVAGMGALEAGLTVARRQLVIAPGGRLERTLRVRMFEHLTDLPGSFHDRWTGGQLLSRSISDIRRFRRWLAFGAIMTVVNSVTIIVGITLMVATNWLLGLVYFAAAGPAFVIAVRARRKYRRLSRRAQDQVGDLATRVEESVQGIRVLKAYGRELNALRSFGEQAHELRMTEIGKSRQRALITLVMVSLPEIALAAVLALGIVQVANGSLTAGGLLAFFATANLLVNPLERLSDQFAMSMDAKAAIDRYLEVLHEPNPVRDPADPVAVPEGPGVVELDGVHFAYDGGDRRPVLVDASLRLEGGETVALVGLTATGKSTLAQLIARFYDVDAGAVRIDGVDVRDLRRHDVRQLVAFAFDEPVLFSTTVRENVRLGRRDATDEEIWEALDVAQADFVHRLPDALDTVVGEEGLSLSGGQRQRLSLARAILSRPRVLVLDDPLSALDVRTEAAVARRLREHLTGTTTLIVANRPSTVNVADRVAVLDGGRIVGFGTHDEVYRTCPVYRTILSGQRAADPAELETVSA